MPLLDRDTVIDRPVLVDRENGEDDEETAEADDDVEDAKVETVETFGEGGGPVLHQIEFEPGDYNVVSGANAAAVLATGKEEGSEFTSAFVNAAIQLKQLQQQGEDIRFMSQFAVDNGVSNLGLNEQDIDVLRQYEDEAGEDEPQDLDDEEDEDVGGDAEEAEELEDIEDDIEEVKEEDEDDTEKEEDG